MIYNVDLRCHACDAEFTVQNVDFDKLGFLPVEAQCAYCLMAGDASAVPPLFHRVLRIQQN